MVAYNTHNTCIATNTKAALVMLENSQCTYTVNALTKSLMAMETKFGTSSTTENAVSSLTSLRDKVHLRPLKLSRQITHMLHP